MSIWNGSTLSRSIRRELVNIYAFLGVDSTQLPRQHTTNLTLQDVSKVALLDYSMDGIPVGMSWNGTSST